MCVFKDKGKIIFVIPHFCHLGKYRQTTFVKEINIYFIILNQLNEIARNILYAFKCFFDDTVDLVL